jgi:hypothetical protein
MLMDVCFRRKTYSREEKKVQKLRGAVFDALGQRGVREKDPIFRLSDKQ